VGDRARDVEQFDGFFASFLHRAAAGRDAKTCPGLGGAPCLRVSSVVVNLIQRGPGVCFSHGQERDQFPKVDRTFSLLGLWHRSFAAGDSLCPLRLPHSVIDVINQKLGYLVRCGDPDAIDSIVPMAYGNLALDLLLGKT
jgi:hypothetical protein